MSERRSIAIKRNATLAGGRIICEALADGIRAAGDEARIVEETEARLVACWGWRRGQRFRNAGADVLVMERGYLGDRLNTWTSLGWNGLNGNACFGPCGDRGERFEEHFGGLMKPWRGEGKGGYALILGQFPGDMAIHGVDMEAFYEQAADAMRSRGFEDRFRPHPAAEARGVHVKALPKCRMEGSLEEALDGAAVAVTWNSNSGVDAALAGVPVIACGKGAMVAPVAAQTLSLRLVRPDRSHWAASLAWTQWTIDEIASGAAWRHVRTVLGKGAQAA